MRASGNPLRLALRDVIVMERIKLLSGIGDKINLPFAYLIVEVDFECLEEYIFILEMVMKLFNDVHTSLVNICSSLFPHFLNELATALEVVDNMLLETTKLAVG